MAKVTFKDFFNTEIYHHQVMFSVTPDKHCYVYALSDLNKKININAIKFYDVKLNKNFHFSAGAIKAADNYLIETLKSRVKGMRDNLWKKSLEDSSFLCAPCGTKSKKKAEDSKGGAEDYFIDAVCYWGKVTRNIPSIRKHFDDTKNRKLFIETIKTRINSKGDSAYKDIEKDYDSVPGIGLSIYTKLLRVIEPKKFFVVDSVYEEFFGKSVDYLQYHTAFQCVLNELKQDHVELKGLKIGNFESILYYLIQYCKTNLRNSKFSIF